MTVGDDIVARRGDRQLGDEFEPDLVPRRLGLVGDIKEVARNQNRGHRPAAGQTRCPGQTQHIKEITGALNIDPIGVDVSNFARRCTGTAEGVLELNRRSGNLPGRRSESVQDVGVVLGTRGRRVIIHNDIGIQIRITAVGDQKSPFGSGKCRDRGRFDVQPRVGLLDLDGPHTRGRIDVDDAVERRNVAAAQRRTDRRVLGTDLVIKQIGVVLRTVGKPAVSEQFAVAVKRDLFDFLQVRAVAEPPDAAVTLTGERIDQHQRTAGVDVQNDVVQRVIDDRIFVEQQRLFDEIGVHQNVGVKSILDDPAGRQNRFQSHQRVSRVGIKELAQLRRHQLCVRHRDGVRPGQQFLAAQVRIIGRQRTRFQQSQIVVLPHTRHGQIVRDVAVVGRQDQVARGVKDIKCHVRAAQTGGIIQIEHRR